MIYLMSPYSDADPAVRLARFHAVCKQAADMMKAGLLVISPIAHTHSIALQGELPKGWDYWRPLDELLLGICNEGWVLMLDGWRESVGVKRELQLCELAKKPVLYVRPATPLHATMRP